MVGIFRAYDIRGVYGKDVDTSTFLRIGEALGSELGEGDVVVGYDARLSSVALKEAFIAGVLSTGRNCIDIGMVSSPVLYFASIHYGAKTGAMITASHNPPQYNGVKFCYNGEAYSYETGLDRIEQRVKNDDFVIKSWSEVGSLSHRSVLDDYRGHLIERIRIKKRLKVVIDVGNGVTGFSEEIFRHVGCDVRMLFKEPDGSFPNHLADPVQEETLNTLQKIVLEEEADLGIAFDGDGDRVGFVDDKGRIIKPDIALILLSRDLMNRKKRAKIVVTPLSSRALIDDVKSHGGQIVLSKVGHSYVQEKLLKEDALLAGELSGHFYLRENYYGYDDAIYAALKVTELIASFDRPFSQIIESLPSYFSSGEIRVPCPDDKKFQIVSDLKKFFRDQSYEILDIDGVRVEFDEGWGIVRASNTEPALVLRFEAENEKEYLEIRRIIEKEVRARGG